MHKHMQQVVGLDISVLLASAHTGTGTHACREHKGSSLQRVSDTDMQRTQRDGHIGAAG